MCVNGLGLGEMIWAFGKLILSKVSWIGLPRCTSESKTMELASHKFKQSLIDILSSQQSKLDKKNFKCL